MLNNLIRRIKALSYAYRIEKGFGLSAIRSERELKAVVNFCSKELENTENMKLNPERKDIYEMTITLYKQGLSRDTNVFTKPHKFGDAYYNDVEEFINDYVGWYWN